MTKLFTNKMQEQVREFHEAFGHPVSDKPNPIPLDRALGRSSWGSGEEIVELLHASSKNSDEFVEAFRALLVGLKKAYQKQQDKPFPKTKEERVIAQGDAIADHLYFAFGDAVEAGVDIEKVFKIVHDANMSKLFVNEETGELYAKYDENNKVMKSPNFAPPEGKIKAEIKRQLGKAKKADNDEIKLQSNQGIEYDFVEDTVKITTDGEIKFTGNVKFKEVSEPEE